MERWIRRSRKELKPLSSLYVEATLTPAKVWCKSKGKSALHWHQIVVNKVYRLKLKGKVFRCVLCTEHNTLIKV